MTAPTNIVMAQADVKEVQPHLLDLLYAVPRLSESLPTDVAKALTATSRACRQVLQQQVTIVRMSSNSLCTQTQLTETVPLLVSGAWTQLQHLHIGFDLPIHPPERIHAILQADWPAMRTLDLQNIVLTDHAIALLVAKPWPVLSRLNLTKTRLSRDACLRLLTGQWPLLESLSLGWNHLHSSFFKQLVKDNRLVHLTQLHLPGTRFDKAAVSELVHYQAPLRVLNLDWNQLPASVITVLSRAKWESLEVLSICACQDVDATAMGHLSRARWPRLRSLNIGMNSTLRRATPMEVLSQAKWPLLTDLNVSGIKLTYDALAYLLRGRSSLRAIDLSCCGLTEATCSVLQKASCPLLETLNLDCNDIKAASIYRLTGAHWPLLRRLVLSGNVLDMSALRNLSLGDWPDLEQLEVSYHEISYAHAAIGLTSLAHGTWPKLRVLKIDSIHHITHDILQALLSGSEPLWHVMSGASMPACGTGNDDTMIQHNYPCPKLHPVCFPLLEVLELCSTTTSVKIDVGRLAYYPLVCLQFQAQSSNLSSHMTLM